MRIIQYKRKANGKYQILFDNQTKIDLYEEVILKYELLLKKEIPQEDFLDIISCNQEWDVYYVALKSIKARFKSVYDTKEFLLRKEYPQVLVEKAVARLVSQGYLNDKEFARSYIHTQMITSMKGPYKIRKELQQKKIADEIIDKEILVFSLDEQKQKIYKGTMKLMKQNHSRAGNVLKRKIFHDFVLLGYEETLIREVLSQFDFLPDENLAKVEYQKIRKKLEKKYQGQELEYRIRQKMFQKGFLYEVTQLD